MVAKFLTDMSISRRLSRFGPNLGQLIAIRTGPVLSCVPSFLNGVC